MSKDLTYRAPRGVRDVLPEELGPWEALEAAAEGVARARGFREIRPALLEETDLFSRSVGEVTDIVEKEMFTILRGDSSYTLRPEGTAGIVRAYLQAGYQHTAPVQRLFHVGPMFRYERPQKGRERMFTQFDVEALGSRDPRLDAEIIHLSCAFFDALGLDGLEVRMNSMGDGDDRDRYRGAIRERLRPRLAELCDLCRSRFDRNVLRVLDCKNPSCRAIFEDAQDIQMMGFLDDGNRAHFETVLGLLEDLGRSVKVDGQLVRGLDYYTRTVFEVHDTSLGARSALGGGGRYDHLIQDLGGPDLGAVGVAIGFTSTMLALEQRGIAAPPVRPAADAYVVAAAAGDADLARQVFLLAEELRGGGVSCVYDTEGRGLKGQMKAAGKGAHRLAVVVGPDELARGVVQLKDLDAGEQSEVARAELVSAARGILGAS